MRSPARFLNSMTEEQLDLRAGAALIFHHVRRQWLHMGSGLLSALVWTGARLSIPVLTGVAIDRAIDIPGGTDLDLLLVMAVAVVLIAALQGAAAAMRAVGLTQGYERALASGWWPSEEVLPADLRRAA